MNLILQAIKALFRKVENHITASATALSRKITTVQGRADMAYKRASTAQTAADKAQTTADKAQTTADKAQTAADKAQTAADKAQTTANKKLSVQTLSFNQTLSEVFNIQVGEQYAVSQNGYITEDFFGTGDCIVLTLKTSSGGVFFFRQAVLTATSSFEAVGIVSWDMDDAPERVYAVHLRNRTTTSFVNLTRLA